MVHTHYNEESEKFNRLRYNMCGRVRKQRYPREGETNVQWRCKVIGYRILLDDGNKVRLAPLAIIARDREPPFSSAS